MATTLNTQGKYDVLNGIKAIYTGATLVNSIDPADYTTNVPACDAPLSLTAASWSLSGTTLSNTAPLVFNCSIGDIPYKIVLFSSSTTGGMVIDLTGAAGDAFEFTTAGTFTIPIGDLTITVA